MKKLLLLCIPMVLSACGGGSTPAPAPSTGGTTGGGTTGGGTTLSYPYNPDVSPVERTDQRVPYYGEWVWAVSFDNGTSFIGRMSIAKKVSPLSGFNNASAGAGVWCPNGDTCAYGSDIGLMGTVTSSGSSYLFGGLYDNSAFQQIKFVGLDLDGRVGTEVNGAPTLSGIGAWQFYSGDNATVGFAMAQVSTNPPIKAATVNPSNLVIEKVGTIQTRFGKLSNADLQQRAIAVLKQTQ